MKRVLTILITGIWLCGSLYAQDSKLDKFLNKKVLDHKAEKAKLGDKGNKGKEKIRVILKFIPSLKAGADVLFPVLVRDIEALGLPDSTVATLKGPRLDIINVINLNRPIPVADGFTGDVITLDAAIDSSFPNGRRIGGGTAPNRNQVNVNSVLISLIAAGDPAAGLVKGVETNDKDYLDRFPFLAIAHQSLLHGHGGLNVASVRQSTMPFPALRRRSRRRSPRSG